MDVSQNQDPFAPEPQTAAQQASAEELAPPNRSEGDGPGSPNPEIFPDTADHEGDTVDFPANRFVDAGASPQEIEELQAEFDALDENGQQARCDELAAVATGDLVEELQRRRAAADAESEDEAEDHVDDDHASEQDDEDDDLDDDDEPEALTGTLTPPEQDAGVKSAPDRAAAAPSSPASSTTPSAPTSPSSSPKPPSAA